LPVCAASVAVVSNVAPAKNKNEAIIALCKLLVCVFTFGPFYGASIAVTLIAMQNGCLDVKA
jgi:hypothetical protein